MNIENMIQNQRHNTLQAYDRSGYEYSTSVLSNIVTYGLASKQRIINKLGNSVVVVPRQLTDIELLESSFTLRDMVNAHPDYSFSFMSKTVTERGTGKCRPIRKFLAERDWTDEGIDHVLSLCDQRRQLFIAAHPWFLIGSSVGANGRNVESSCHHPASGTNDYKSGPISYARDNCTIIFGLWNEDAQGMTGRQLVYVDQNAGIITGRLYGHITEGDSSHVRKELYKLLMPDVPASAWKKTKDFDIDKDEYYGYLDNDYFTGYRPNKDHCIEVCLEVPVCPSCGGIQHEGYLLCDDCYDGDRCKCYNCGDRISEDDCYYDPDGNTMCYYCFEREYFSCYRCGESHDRDDACIEEGSGNMYCQECAERTGLTQCENCEKWTEDIHSMVDGNYLCGSCLPSDAVQCSDCHCWEREKYTTSTIEGSVLCTNCDRSVEECEECGQYTTSGLTETIHGSSVCSECVNTMFPNVCPGCGLAQEGEGVCSDECAANNLFKMAA